MTRVVLTQPINPAGMAVLRAAGLDIRLAQSASREDVYPLLSDADALLVRTNGRYDADLFDHAPRLKVLGRSGVGVDHIDLAAAHERGIVVVNTPEANSQSVAEFTAEMMIAVSRFRLRADAAVRHGRWSEREELIGTELFGRTCSIIGLGRVGSRVARICRLGFQMRVLYYDIVRKPEYERDLDIEFTDFPTAVNAADFLTMHVPLTDLTRHMIDASVLKRMKPTAYLLNAARGEVVDTHALARALQEKSIAGAAIDVFPEEPLPTDDPLQRAPNTVFSPHMASHTADAVRRMSLVAEDVIRVLNGEPPLYPVNPEDLP